MSTIHDVLHGMIEDAQKYEALSKRAARSLDRRSSGVGPDDELAGFLREIVRLSHSQALEAKRLLYEQPQEQHLHEESLLQRAD